ncbi:MAG: hypothetical protein FWG75_07665 [Cystobacterineae bacterium]|nr:hypothetical protein [Cystobacterineae bacterium]
MKVYAINFYALFFLLGAVFSTEVFATAQISDKLIYKGKKYALHSNPLEEYFQKHPQKRPKTESVSSALWRGYIATFEFKNKELFLKDIEGLVHSKDGKPERKSFLAELLDEKDSMKIDWFSGTLVVPDGKQIEYVHLGYLSLYEKYILIEIKEGNFVKEKRMSHKEYKKFRDKQFQNKKFREEQLRDGPFQNKKFRDEQPRTLEKPLYYQKDTRDRLIYKDKEYFLYSNPSQEYLKKYPQKRRIFSSPDTPWMSSHSATFELKDNELFLKGIKVFNLAEDREAKPKSFSAEFLEGKALAKADWFSGILLLPEGQQAEGLSFHEEYIFIEIKDGNLIKEAKINNKKYKQFIDKQPEQFDKLIYKGKKYALHSHPLNEYFIKHPEKEGVFPWMPLPFMRRYVATFRIKNNELFLEDMEGFTLSKEGKPEPKSFLAEFLDGKTSLKIDWFSGTLLLPENKNIKHVRGAYLSYYEKYMLIEIKEGNFVQETRMSQEEYKKTQDEQVRDKQREELKGFIKRQREEIQKIKKQQRQGT